MEQEQGRNSLQDAFMHLSWQLLEVTQNAAIAAARKAGKGDKNLADQAAVDAMRSTLDHMTGFQSNIKIGEGERDDAPMLFIGERLGRGHISIDIAVDPLENTNATADLKPGAVCVLAAAPYIDILQPPEENIYRIAKALGREDPSQLTVTILDRPRHEELIRRVRATGARVNLIADGDLMPCIFTCFKGAGVHAVMGIGAAPEGVISATAIKLLGGGMQAVFKPKNDADRERLLRMGIKLDQVYTPETLAPGKNLIFCATAVTPILTTTKAVLEGVSFFPGGAKTNSLVISNGFMNFVPTTHVLDGDTFVRQGSEFRLW